MRAAVTFLPLVLVSVPGACSEPTRRAAVPTAAVPAGAADAAAPDAASPPDAAPADAEAPVGALPVPDEDDFWSQPPSIDELDTTVTIEALTAIRGWPRARRVARGGGRVMLTLHVDARDGLFLSVVEDDTGIVETYPLGAAALRGPNHTFDGNTFPARGHAGDYTGPIVFAIRALPAVDAADDQRRQVAVWADGALLQVAERGPGATAWTPRLRLRFRRGTTFDGIGTTYPH